MISKEMSEMELRMDLGIYVKILYMHFHFI